MSATSSTYPATSKYIPNVLYKLPLPIKSNLEKNL